MVLARHSAFTPQDFQKAMGFSIGFDSLFDRLFDMDTTRDSGYPPYNIRKVNELQYVIELALAGFSKDDIEVEVTEGQLAIRSKKLEEKTEIVKKRFVNMPINRPKFWSGYEITPFLIEFWQARDNRLHDRIVYKKLKNKNWKKHRLSP